MSEEKLIANCSPTLAGLKTGSLFNCWYDTPEQMRQAVRHWNGVLTEKGLRMLPLGFWDGRALIYVYRPSQLSRDLKNANAAQILRGLGYRPEAPECCVTHLITRLRESAEFPHEIGLFLGYPPEDVAGFIEHRAADCKCAGCWKVYGDAEAAQRTFETYKKCTEAYRRQYRLGHGIRHLAVAG